MFIDSNRPGQFPFKTKKLRVVNRCGTTALALGDVVALDLDASDTATQALSGVGGVTLASLTEAMFHNIVQVSAAPLNALVAVVTSLLSGAGADNAEVEVAISGKVQAKVGGTDWSVAYSSCGVALMADTTSANRRFVAASDNANRGKAAIIIEAIDEKLDDDANTDNTTAWVWLLGWGSSVGPVSDA